ncbi:HD family phosphohydrolase [Paenibacillus sp. N1-5-1-14]|uniref:HD family phosphohydrolase n=1 Tax=Paenibacillus radicibacter TaxID=2972488 RepID=UPI0021598D08|nr:HD family phosphohydrolase [Paenibacillus radicibacter]MCR8644938.1 HD family phosphohydrolase [Paenibacillus radicibacter]
MTFFSGWTYINILIAVVVILLGWLIFDKRYKKPSDANEKIPFGYEPTKEVFIDPKDGLRYRVYYSARTGERRYVQEDLNS